MVAAVAGVAALAVVLVQRFVGETAESVASHSARQEAAVLAAAEVQDRWQAESPTSQTEADRINRLYGAKCGRLGILYADIDLSPMHKGGKLNAQNTGWNLTLRPKCVFA